jgi:hypothetical protein
MQKYLLRRHVHLCLMPEAAIFLDLMRDQYLGLDQAQASALDRIFGAAPLRDERDELFAGSLMDRGLLTLDPAAGKAMHPIDIASPDFPLVNRDLESSRVVRISHVWIGATAGLRTYWRLRQLSLQKVIYIVRERKLRKRRHTGAGDLTRMRELTRSFYSIRPFLYTHHDKCLFDSLTLIEYLASFGLFPSLVLGVRPNPFTAHCWVQQDRYVLNGSPDYIRWFKPIMVV